MAATPQIRLIRIRVLFRATLPSRLESAVTRGPLVSSLAGSPVAPLLHCCPPIKKARRKIRFLAGSELHRCWPLVCQLKLILKFN